MSLVIDAKFRCHDEKHGNRVSEKLRRNDDRLQSVLRVIQQAKRVIATPKEMLSRLDGRNYRWSNGPSTLHFTVTDGRLYARLNRDEPWLVVPVGTNTLRRYGSNGKFAEFVFTKDLGVILFNAGDGGIRTGVRVGN